MIDSDFPETPAAIDRFAAIRHNEKTTKASLLEFAHKHELIWPQDFHDNCKSIRVERIDDAKASTISKSVTMSMQEGSHTDFMKELARIFGEDPASWVSAEITLITNERLQPVERKWDDLGPYFRKHWEDVDAIQVQLQKPE